jgi:hypothetical protein
MERAAWSYVLKAIIGILGTDPYPFGKAGEE